MIEEVKWEGTTYAPIPAKFEAGTPDIAGVIGLGAAIDYLESLGWPALQRHEDELLEHATRRLSAVPGLRIIGTAEFKTGVVSFVIDDPPISSLDIGMKLDGQGIAVRTGHHCAQPLMDAFGIPGTTRASFAFYNTIDEIDQLVGALEGIVEEAKGRKGSVPRNQATEVAWPDPKGESPDDAARQLIEDFVFLKEAGEDPRDFILEMGRKLPFMPDSEKNEATHVKGCMSQVWLTARHHPRAGAEDALDFIADSDAEIVKGLIGVLQHVFSGQSAAAILAFDFEALLKKLDFQNLISVQRRSGVEAMINRIMSLARANAKQ